MFSVKDAALTPFQLDALKYAAGTERYNREELEAINRLVPSLCDCLLMKKGDDNVYESMEATRQEALERGMDDVEERRDGQRRTSMLQTTVDNIYKLMVAQENGVPYMNEKGMLATIAGKMSSVTGVLGDMAEIKQAVPWLDSTQKVRFTDDKQVVTLSKATMDDFENLFEEYGDDDGLDFPGKKRRPHKVPKKVPKVKKPGLLAKGKGLLKTGVLKAAPILTGGMGTGGLLTASGSTIAGLGAGAMATAAAGVAAAGAIGYGIGTILNKGIDKIVSKTTDGEAKSLGGLFYNLTHRKEMKEMRIRKAEALKRKTEAAKIEKTKEKKLFDLTGKTGGLEVAGAILGSAAVGSVALVKNIADVSIPVVKGIVDTSVPVVKGIIDTSVPVAKELASQSMDIAEKLTTGSLSLAKDIVNNGINIEWQDSLKTGWESSVKAMDELSDSIDVLSSIKDSQTVGAMQQIYQDGKSFVTGGSSTTNIQVPISAHDEDRGTNLLVYSYGA